MSKKVVTFGEVMMRLAPPGYQRFVQTNSFDATYAGGEANVAASLAQYGYDAYFVTKLPPTELGLACKFFLQKYGIKTDYIKMEGSRLGIYFLEAGASQRASKVIYDRKDSAIAQVQPGPLLLHTDGVPGVVAGVGEGGPVGHGVSPWCCCGLGGW